MKSVFKTAVAAAAAAVFVASVAVAGDQQRGGDQRRGPGFGQGRPNGPGGPGGRGGPIGVPFEDLTDAQRQQVKAIMEEQRQGTGGPGPEMKLRQALEQELLADAPNDQKIEELKQQLVAASAEQLARHIAVQRRINPILTAEQRAKARERIAQRGEKRQRSVTSNGR